MSSFPISDTKFPQAFLSTKISEFAVSQPVEQTLSEQLPVLFLYFLTFPSLLFPIPSNGLPEFRPSSNKQAFRDL